MARQVGQISKMMSKTKLNPQLQVSAFITTGDEPAFDDTAYLKEDLKRCDAKINKIKSVLDNWIPEDIAAQAKKSLEADLENEKAQRASIKAQLKARNVKEGK